MLLYNVHKIELTNALSALSLLDDCITYEFAKTENNHVLLVLMASRNLTQEEEKLLQFYGELITLNKEEKQEVFIVLINQ